MLSLLSAVEVVVPPTGPSLLAVLPSSTNFCSEGLLLSLMGLMS
jgi:hypothetical protein